MEENMIVNPDNKAIEKPKREKSIVDSVQDRVKKLEMEGSINFPPNYSVANALRSAWLMIQDLKDRSSRPALEVCTKDSVANALLNTVVQGLNPAKKQIYYIVYGDQLQAQRSYFGTMAVTKRIPGVTDIFADVVWKDDVIETTKEAGSWVILKHESDIDNIGDSVEDIRAAYCTITFKGGGSYTEIMSRKQIEKAWNKSRSKDHATHKEFPDQMAKKTVINRACKFFLNSSDDSDLLIEAFNATGERYAEPSPAAAPAEDDRLKELNSEISVAPVATQPRVQLAAPKQEPKAIDLPTASVKEKEPIPVESVAASPREGGTDNEQLSIDG